MKNVRLIFLVIIAVLFLGISKVNAQDGEPQTVIIRAFETFTGSSSKMFVNGPDGSSKTIELNNIETGKGYIGSSENARNYKKK